VSEERVAYLEEHRSEFPGVEVADTYLRNYEHKSLAAQILGYVREIDEDELKRKNPVDDYRAGDKVGKAGVEAAFDTYLRGTPGTAEIRVDSLGRPQSGIRDQKLPSPGYDVRLTLDVRLQRAAEQALTFGIERAIEHENWYANGGAVVALDPRDGAILAVASNPTYKPSLYVGRVDPEKLLPITDEQLAKENNFPAVNRAIAGLYAPGSTFKPVTALAAIETGLISPYETIQCTPVAYYGRDRQAFKNWNPNVNEPMNLPTALAASCDTYFYEIGNEFYELPGSRGQPLQKWARSFGFGGTSLRDLGGEEEGLVPTIPWKRRHYDSAIDKLWTPGDSIQLAIGQKDLLATPLQMTRFYALLANRGKLVTPYLVSDVEQPGSAGRPPVVRRRFAPVPPKQTDVSDAALTAVDEGLRAATSQSYGTSVGVFGSFPVRIAGKTGTSERWNSELGRYIDQSWWCGYGQEWGSKGPIALCVVIENGGFGGEAAAPAALKVLEEHYGVQAGLVAEVASD
jgi:penicillin-binding protein 2